ncbi:cytochrome b/b6 domain-containing protein [Magnetospirillum moscoviense]|uniref:Cytochrome b561 bacterial/Ni-hydrogenase domain-containing protein n=1 Tax=Magnetospirillum moscoviense TaxID=1437059 RepID=A0A178MIJ5_9PROT|nr:cytochrome b/b6 domain-containing protein [Magnetospirillum moscoviense]OAN48542.1 hypothetical protein A6A05_15115 [Magnetospirillum moscoviense]
MSRQVKVWDLPTRMFHWGLACLCVLGWVSFKFGDAGMVWHRWNGYAVLTLVLFRVLWGLVGSDTARFMRFVAGPVATARYLIGLARRRHQPVVGHNPAGGWMVVALIGGLLVLAACGLFATDDIMVEGPLAHAASSAQVKLATKIHKSLYWVLAAMVGLHVAAVIFHRVVLGEKLVGAMITGTAEIEGADAPRLAPIWLAAACAAIAAGSLALVLAFV